MKQIKYMYFVGWGISIFKFVWKCKGRVMRKRGGLIQTTAILKLSDIKKKPVYLKHVHCDL